MNLRTTLLLLILVAAAGIAWVFFLQQDPFQQASNSLAILRNEITPKDLSYVKIHRAKGTIVFERDKSGGWSMPGGWPIRRVEVEAVVKRLGELDSRFRPIPFASDGELVKYGLKEPKLKVELKAKNKKYEFQFGLAETGGPAFSRPVYLRINKEKEILQLSPGLVALLDQDPEKYQRHRLFPVVPVAEDESSKTEDQLDAVEMTVKGEKDKYTLAKNGQKWLLQAPVTDRLSPDKLKDIVTLVPDIWAERFVDREKKKLSEFGLDKPKQSIKIALKSGMTRTLQIGKVSRTNDRVEIIKPPFPGGRPTPKFIKEEFRYARLKNNDQVFEIKADHLDKIFVAANTLRDDKLARFETEKVQRIEIQRAGTSIVLAKEKDNWLVRKPMQFKAENSKVEKLLDELSDLNAKSDDIIDKGDPKKYGLDKPARIKLTIKNKKSTETKSIEFRIGKHDVKDKKLYVQVDRWQRIDPVGDGLFELLKRPVLAYRDPKVLDLAMDALAAVKVQSGKDEFSLLKIDGEWKLAAPVVAAVDSAKSDKLLELGELTAEEYVADGPDSAALKKYGLDKPQHQITFIPADKKNKSQTLLIGKKHKDKEEYFAKIKGSSTVFTLNKSVLETVATNSLNYRSLKLWNLAATDIKHIRLAKQGKEQYHLELDQERWRMTAPFSAPAAKAVADEITKALDGLQAGRFVAHTAKDAAKFGLDKAAMSVSVSSASKSGQGSRQLLVGKKLPGKSDDLYATLKGKPGVFVVTAKLVQALDRQPLELLDRQLLTLDEMAISKIQVTGKEPYTLTKEKEKWKVLGAPGSPFSADSVSVKNQLAAVANLSAQSFADYGAKADLKKYGLQKPKTMVKIELAPLDKKSKPKTHTIAIGQNVKDKPGLVYARVDNGPGVVVLNDVHSLANSPLKLVSRSVLNFDRDKVSTIKRLAGGKLLELIRKKDGWRVTQPKQAKADAQVLKNITSELASLRASEIAAYPATDLAKFDLKDPPVSITIEIKNDKGKPKTHVLHIGKEVGKNGLQRYARLATGKSVFVLPEQLSRTITAPPLAFHNRNLIQFDSANRLMIEEKSGRTITFAESEGDWSVTQPAKLDAESDDIKQLLEEVRKLRADELVVENAKDLKKYGLDQPRRRFEFYKDKKQQLVLLVGAPSEKKPNATEKSDRVYAKLGKKDLVFLLPAELGGKLLREYRRRKIWPDLDAMQASILSYRYPKKSFRFIKLGKKWVALGDSKLTIDKKKVDDTLDALSKLEAEQYVADRGVGKMKLYGLETPALTIEIMGDEKKHTLIVGRKNGGKGQYYATVAEDKDRAIFSLSQAAAQQIVRTLMEFVEKQKKKQKQ